MALIPSGKEALFDLPLIGSKPVQIFLQVLFIKAMEFQQVTDRMLASQSNRRQPGPLIEHPGHHVPESELPVHTGA